MKIFLSTFSFTWCLVFYWKFHILFFLYLSCEISSVTFTSIIYNCDLIYLCILINVTSLLLFLFYIPSSFISFDNMVFKVYLVNLTYQENAEYHLTPELSRSGVAWPKNCNKFVILKIYPLQCTLVTVTTIKILKVVDNI